MNNAIKALAFSSLSISFAACSNKPLVVKHIAEQDPVRNNTVFIASHGWHTGIILPAEELNTELSFLYKRFGKVKHYEFGWGDSGFYQAREITTELTLQAIFWPTDSVVHVVAINTDPVRYFPQSEVIKLSLSRGKLASLRKFIGNSFFRNKDDQVIKMKSGIYGNSQFYKGEGDYYLMNTCNKWTAKGLKSAGMDISTTFKLTSDSIMSFLRNHTLHESPPAADTD